MKQKRVPCKAIGNRCQLVIAQLLILMLLTGETIYTQPTTSFRYQPSFVAVVVKNIDSSASWYQAVFNARITDRINDSLNGVRAVIMESRALLIELLENRSWPGQKELLSHRPAGTRVQGFFKFGVKVKDMNDCLAQLAKLKIVPERIYTSSTTGKRNFLVTDPDGNIVQYFE